MDLYKLVKNVRETDYSNNNKIIDSYNKEAKKIFDYLLAMQS